jgi:hypothetical protein
LRTRAATVLTLAALAAAVLAHGADLDPDQARRVELGVGWFRGMLTADVDIEKKGLPDGRLLVVFVYTDDERRARGLADAFASAAPIRKHPVVAEIVAAGADLAAYARRNPAGIFLAQPPATRSLKSILSFARDRSVLVYSPFEGHVEEGVPGGLAVEAQVRPYINARALAESRITLKEIFLQASKVLP